MSTNSQSILTTVKRTLGIEEDHTAFDGEIIVHINSAFGTLHQLGVGPQMGFEIEDASAIWSEVIDEDLTLSSVKSYIYLYVRLLFDPPTQSWVLTSMEKKLDELTWRITQQADELLALGGELILDGGEA